MHAEKTGRLFRRAESACRTAQNAAQGLDAAGEYQAIFTDLLADPSVLVPFILIGIRR